MIVSGLEPRILLPADMASLVAALQEATPRSRLLAGGTDLVRSMRWDGLAPDTIIDLSGVRELSCVEQRDGRLVVGATTTLTDVQADPLILRHAPCLAQAAATMGSVQIRNIATIGGNVANASPCGDTIPVLLALEAAVGILRPDGSTDERPVREVVTGYETTSLAHDEAITHIAFTLPPSSYRSAFVKIGSRTTVTIARLSMAVVAEYDPRTDVLGAVRIGLGALGETAFREAALEECLSGRRADAESLALFAAACTAAVQRAIPGRYSLPYKQAAAVGLAQDAWTCLGLAAARTEGAI